MTILRYLRESSALGSADINAYSILNAALDYSESFAVGTADEVALFIKNGAATATGTGPAMTASLEVSPDGGTAWFAAPVSINSTTQAEVAIASITPLVQAYLYTWIGIAPSGTKSQPLYRWAFTYDNADNDVPAISMWLSVRNRNSWRQ
jgi:hypothetical protein